MQNFTEQCRKLLTSMLTRLVSDLSALISFLYLGIRIPADIMRLLSDRLRKSAPECICQIFQVLALPLTVLSISCRKLCHFTADNLPILWDHVLEVPRRLLATLDQFSNKKAEKLNAKKYWRIYRSCVKQMLVLKNPVLRHFIGSKIVILIMVCLQFISWFTTYSGSKFHMAGINEAAPLCFSIAVQSGLLYYAYTTFENGRLRLGKLLGLLLFTAISCSFSFSGLASRMLPLEQEYRAEYQDYTLNFGLAKTEGLNNGLLPDEIVAIAQDFYAAIDSLIQQAGVVKQANDVKIAANNNMSNSSDTVKTVKNDYSAGTRTSSTQTTKTAAYIAGQTENSSLLQKNAEIDGYVQTLEHALYSDPTARTLNITPEDIKAYLTADPGTRYSDPAMNAIRAGTASINQALAAFSTIPEIQIPENLAPLDLDQLADLVQKTEQLQAVSLCPFQDFLPISIPNTLIPQTAQPYLKLFTDQSSTQKLMDIRTAMQAEVRDKTSALDTAGQDLISAGTLSDLLEKKDSILVMEDASLVPFIRLSDPRYRPLLAAALILAGMVDGLTLFISLTGERNKRSVLKAATNRDYIHDQDELFAIVFESLQGTLENELINAAVLEVPDFEQFRRTCNGYLSNIVSVIKAFLRNFRVSPWTMANGYGLYAEADVFGGEYEEIYTPIITILCELGYMKIVSKNDFSLIKSEFNRVATELRYTVPESKDGEETYIYLLRFKAENYLRKNLADSITALPFGDGIIPLTSKRTDRDDAKKSHA